MNEAIAPESAEKLYRTARTRLAEAGIPSPDLDASLLLEHATGLTVLARITEPGRLVPTEKIERFRTCVERRLAREPVHRIIGEREFYGLPLQLTAATLVPRPDTETLVDLVLPLVRNRVARNGHCRILDMGTGSGAIALALLAEVSRATATGTDISAEALMVAQANASLLGLADRFTAIRSDWFEEVTGQFELIVSNPPYIRSDDIPGLDPDVREHDPLQALDGGRDGLDAYRVLAERSAPFLAENGAIAVEIGHDQAPEVTNLFVSAGYRRIGRRKDYGGHVRALFFVK
ncbi:peptide chain release factor N(5)-glutamine methyltransferase [Oricola thermophila]|uniref:Release factor glutamine methyltransferase n=1 Tax=Oricola thermophila TaxID=2742145 RepID=A0A6N1VHG5_9HYPH|nr:peptide chain release factor N(5)-glutamine methyltransferase [Oricola thermophila]QKV20204.1 peptide chain release factor N(5)-glutamine methyltransferase [Oricola thermophila]